MDTAPEFYYYNNAAAPFTPEKRLSDAKNGDHFVIEDLLNFPNDDAMDDDSGVEAITSAVDNSVCNPSAAADALFHYPSADFSVSRGGGHFSSELCVPYDDLAELEWLSNFVEESFSSDDLQKLHIIQGMKTRPDQDPASETHQYHFQPQSAQPGRTHRPEVSVPAKAARSKRSRASRGNWTSRLLAVSPPSGNAISAASSSSDSDVGAANQAARSAAVVQNKKKEGPENSGGGEGRRCVHCATDKTPQWRTGPMGPKTLCNACGVRYKSGRLVPEYRPAASPTFVLTKHSNSHRKVVELRRQKEQMRAQQQQQQFLHHHQHQHQHQHQHHHHHHNQSSMMFDVSNGGDDYLIHQHIAPDFRQMI